jgi:crotonobetainyl-CoA:carnitine CoA-transferase CaiB-like acyl-CoA transferase
MTVDLKRPEGLDIFRRLIKVSDIFVENNSPYTVDKLGIGYEELKKLKPDLIMISCSGFGKTGPYSSYKAWGTNIDNYIGHAFLWGYTDVDVSVRPRVNHADATGGATIAFAALMGLNHRLNTGEGKYFDLALYETALPQFGESFMDYSMNRRLHETLGNRDFHGAAPQGVYPCKDGKFVAITVFSDEEWHAFCEVIGEPDWIEDEKFSDPLKRYREQDELDRKISQWTIEHSNYEIMYSLQDAGIAAGVVLDEKDALDDPHLKERFFEVVNHPIAGTHPNPGQAFKMSKIPNRIRGPFCVFGSSNEYVYKEVIGVSDEEFEELKAKGHIGNEVSKEALQALRPFVKTKLKREGNKNGSEGV